MLKVKRDSRQRHLWYWCSLNLKCLFRMAKPQIFQMCAIAHILILFYLRFDWFHTMTNILGPRHSRRLSACIINCLGLWKSIRFRTLSAVRSECTNSYKYAQPIELNTVKSWNFRRSWFMFLKLLVAHNERSHDFINVDFQSILVILCAVTMHIISLKSKCMLSFC